MIEFNLKSTDHLSALFFGGFFTIKESVPDLDELGNHKKYKSGQKSGEFRYKSTDKTIKIRGVGLKPHKKLETKKEGVYQTNETVLKLIAKKENTDAGKIAKLMIRIRELNKQIATYYEGTGKFVHDFDGCVHHELCHFGYDKGNDDVAGGVVTGRLSGQKPNMLNQPKTSENNVREHFIARNGVWVSADFSQIEPCAQAELSRDPGLIRDIKEGKDEHVKYLALKERMSYEEVFKKCKIDKIPEWDVKRSKIKAFTFKRKYGGGAKSISEATGLTVDEVKEIFRAEEQAYPTLIRYQKKNQQLVEIKGELQTIFGRILKFKKGQSPKWLQDKGVMESYKPTQIVNYPVQSVGSADLTLIMIGWFWRKYAIHNRHIKCTNCDVSGVSGVFECVQCNGTGYYDKYLMINTVYDSVDMDCKYEYVDELKGHLKCLTEVQEMCNTYFKYNWIVPVKIDIKQGKSWYEVGL